MIDQVVERLFARGITSGNPSIPEHTGESDDNVVDGVKLV
jgi:hypothetical protein